MKHRFHQQIFVLLGALAHPKKSIFSIMVPAFAILVLALGLFITPLIGESPIDVGLDLSRQPTSAPSLGLGGLSSQQYAMTPIQEQFILKTGPRVSFVMKTDGEAPLPGANDRVAKYRYHAFVPRHALGDLRISIPGLQPADVQRLYIGSIKPVIYSPTGVFCKTTWATRLPRVFPMKGEAAIPLPGYTAIEQGGWITGTVVAGILVLAGSLALLIIFLTCRAIAWLLANPIQPYPIAPFNIKQFLIFFLPLACVWLLYLAAYYPGGMSADSMDQWNQLQRMNFNDWHPAFHTLTMKFVTLAWNSPAAVSLTQVILLSMCMAYAFSLLFRAGVHPAWVAAGYFIVLISPRNGSLVINIWKDTLYTIAMIALILMLVRLFFAKTGTHGYAYWVIMGLLLGVLPLYRHNGLLVTIGMAPLLLLFFHRQAGKVLVCVAISFLFIFLVRDVLFPKLNIRKMAGISSVLNVSHITPIVDQDASLAAQEYAFLEQIKSFKTTWPYNPIMINTIIFEPGYNSRFVYQNADRLMQLDFSLLTRFPQLYLRNFLRVNAYIWSPTTIGNDQIHYISLFASSNEHNSYGLRQQPLSRMLHACLEKFLSASTHPSIAWFCWRPAIHCYLLLLTGLLIFLKLRNVRLLIIFCPIFLNLASLLIAGMSQDHRYLFPITMLSSFFACLVLLPRRMAI